jgi:hypothetical protein
MMVICRVGNSWAEATPVARAKAAARQDKRMKNFLL